MTRAPATQFNRAIVRRPSPSVVDGLRAGDGESPTYAGVRQEHDDYIAALIDADIEVSVLPALEAFPDSIFVEDPALVFPEGAILLNGAAPSRAGEAATLAPVLQEYCGCVLEMSGEGFADGGDILTTGDKVIVGLSARTDKEGAAELVRLLKTFDRAAEIAETPEGVLHFKTDCALLDDTCVLTTARLAQSGVFDGFDQIITPEGEEPAANALRVNEVVFVGAEFPRTIETLDKRGFKLVPLKTTEIGKIDAGLSCMSLRWRRPE